MLVRKWLASRTMRAREAGSKAKMKFSFLLVRHMLIGSVPSRATEGQEPLDRS